MTRVTLVYPPQQSHPKHPHKPEASLAYPYLAGALLDRGHDVSIYDACVGNHDDPADIFYHQTELESGLYRYGVNDDRILNEVANSDMVGITSIFTAQESMALHVGRLIKQHFPNKVLVCGGTNARSRPDVFLRAGFDTVCMSEAEHSIQLLADLVQKHLPVPELAKQLLIEDLDELPIPAWNLHCNERYWQIGRPHGSSKGNGFKYAPIMTSRGCIFKCSYCHISGEQDYPSIGRFRVKSDHRVLKELERLNDLGVDNLFIEDDTFFGHKQRGIRLLKLMKEFGFKVWDVNGINLPHFFNRKQPDLELLDILQECGFKAVSLPVESGSQRIVDQYASKKWRVDYFDVSALIKELVARRITVGVNYMLGYPDETLQEIMATIDLARVHKQAGSSSSNFMIVIPLPGTSLFTKAINEGYLDKDFNPDSFNWRQASMKNTVVPPSQIEEIHQAAYGELNES